MTPSDRHPTRQMGSAFTSIELDRAPRRRRDPGWLARRQKAASTRFFPIWGSRILMVGGSPPRPAWLSPESAEAYLAHAESVTLLGEVGAQAYFAIGFRFEDSPPPAGLEAFGAFRRLREIAPLLDAESATLLAYGKAMAHYHHHHLFCGRCGAPTRSSDAGHLRVCTNDTCGHQDFPRIDPAIIVLVSSGERCLLGRQPMWQDYMYSIIAGFVEPGETLEAAVAREVREETGISVAEVHYQSSQPWPFPRSLMIGFTAEAQSVALELRDGELEDARWFSRADIAQGLRQGTLRLPSAISISHRLIEAWFDAGGRRPLKDLLPD